MPVTVSIAYNIGIDGSTPWTVSTDLVRTIGGAPFVKLRPYDPAFCRLVSHGWITLPKGTRPSLANTEGYKALLKLRNDAVLEFKAEVPKLTPVQAALLRNAPQSKAQAKKKSPRMNASQLQDLRDNVQAIEFLVPGKSKSPPLLISAVKPAHPCDELIVRLDSDTLEHVIVFIRHPLDLSNFTTKRQYGGVHDVGVWRNGSAGLVQKLNKDDATLQEEEAPVQKRFKTLRPDAQPVADSNTSPVPLADNEGDKE